jgi:hypothetical protein
VKRTLNADPDVEPLRILICTDAAREGINLQTYCSDLIHFDLPWNPSRLEQRNGRIDRKLQPPIVEAMSQQPPQSPRSMTVYRIIRIRSEQTAGPSSAMCGSFARFRVPQSLGRAILAGVSEYDAADIAKAIGRRPLPSYEERDGGVLADGQAGAVEGVVP